MFGSRSARHASPVPPVPPVRSAPRAYRTPGGQVYKPFLDMANRSHLLIAGSTGSGKSVTVNGIIHSLILTRSPFMCQFVLIDPKKVELIQFARLPHVARYASEPADMINSLQWSVDETERRFTCMQRAGIRLYDGPDLYVIIDELADLMTTQKNAALPLLQRLAQIGRAAKVHLIACSQNVMAVTIPTVLKCNFSTVLGLRTVNAQQSRFLISEKGCETLPNPASEGVGYGFLRDGADLTKIRIHKYDDAEIDAAIAWWTSSACIASA